MSRIKSMQVAYAVQREFGIKTRAGLNCFYYNPCRFLGAGDNRRDKIEYVEDLTTQIVDFLRDSKQVTDCFCRITGEEVKISFF